MAEQRIKPPSPDEVRAARKCARLSQTAASQLVSDAGAKAYRTWQRYESPVGSTDYRAIPIGLWELFLLLTDQHPTHRMVSRDAASTEKAG